MSQEILVLCPFGVDEGLLSKAAELSSGNVRALVPVGEVSQAALYGAGVIHALDKKEIADEAIFAEYLAEKVQAWGNKIVLAPATIKMRNIMPILAWKMNAGLTADCTALELEENTLLQTRPAFGNSLMATIRSLSGVQMATVRPGTFRACQRQVLKPAVVAEQYTGKGKITQLSFEEFKKGLPLPQAEIIIAGGMGVGSKEGFQKLERLALRLGAGLGASRMAVDAGFAPFCCQVGMTGVTVSPKLYIAVGISGAIQHLAGISGAEKVIAINSDPKAPIFNYADYGIVGDWEVVIESFLEEVLV